MGSSEPVIPSETYLRPNPTREFERDHVLTVKFLCPPFVVEKMTYFEFCRDYPNRVHEVCADCMIFGVQ